MLDAVVGSLKLKFGQSTGEIMLAIAMLHEVRIIFLHLYVQLAVVILPVTLRRGGGGSSGCLSLGVVDVLLSPCVVGLCEDIQIDSRV
jgi:hypothetical protein